MRLVHAGLIVSNLEAAGCFYEGALGLHRIERPELNFEGVWYGLDDGQQIHLMQLDNPYTDCVLPEHGGLDRHVALSVHNLDMVKARLNEKDISYTLSKSGRAALFCRDPDGNTIELIQK